METTETEALPIYSYEELVILWESGEVKKHSIITQMGYLLLQGGEDAPKAEAFLRGLMESESVEEKKCAFEVLRAISEVLRTTRADKEDRRNHE